MTYNGGCILAMKGKDCVAIAADTRFGIQFQMIDTNFQRIYEMGPHLYLGLAGLGTDITTAYEKLRFRVNMYELREGRRMKPKTFASVVSNFLYERRFGPYFVEPIVAGLDPVTSEPYVSVYDLIGCKEEVTDFAVSGTCAEQLYGMCEVLWEKDMEPDDLFEAISQALVNAFDRDAISGWGGVVHIIEKDKVTTKRIKTRMD